MAKTFASRIPIIIAVVALTLTMTFPLVLGQQEDPIEPLATSQPIITARDRVLNAQPLAMYYYYDDPRGLKSIQEHSSEMTLLAPQCYVVEPDGVIQGTLPPGIAEASASSPVALMPLVFNKGFDRSTVTRLLHSPKAQERAVSYMAYLAARENTVGIQIDLENIAPADMARFTRFVRLAAARLHRDGRLLSVAVVPRFADGPPGRPRPGRPSSGEWSAAFDYRALGRAADFLTIMAYDQSHRTGPAGPIAGYEWVRKILDYAVKRVDRKKLLLGLPLYGREWTEASRNSASRSLSALEVRELLARPDVEVQWDDRWRSPWFQYREAGSLRTVWYEDSRSWSEKLRLVTEYRLRGFAAWRLGFEDAEFWPAAQFAPTGGTSTSTASQ